MSCPYCDNPSNNFMYLNQTTLGYSNIEIAINRQGMLRARAFDTENDSMLFQDIVEIKYCPLCGHAFKKG